jgi:hypothetical protein
MYAPSKVPEVTTKAARAVRPFLAMLSQDFQIRQTSGRNRVNLEQPPSRMNNSTALFSINDDRGGGDHYAFEVTWGAENNRPNAVAPFFDGVRAGTAATAT